MARSARSGLARSTTMGLWVLSWFMLGLWLAVGLSACAASATDPVGLYDDDPLPGGEIGFGDGGPAAADGVTLLVDPLAEPRVCGADSVALRGEATPGSDVFARGGRGPSAIVTANPQTGRFCIDVPLQRDARNALEVWAKHPTEGLSAPVRLEVVHDPTACSDEQTDEGVPTIDVAVGATVTASQGPHENEIGNVTDGDPMTWTSWLGGEWLNPWSAYDGWVMVSLKEPAAVEEVVVVWRDELDRTDGSDYGKQYLLLYAPGDLGDPDREIWITPPGGEVTAGTGGEDRFRLDGEPVRHVALWLQYNGAEGWDEGFAIAEIQVRVREGSATSGTVGPLSCATGP